jgi:hypothetical protein
MDLSRLQPLGAHFRGRSTARSINHPTIAFRAVGTVYIAKWQARG